MAIVWISAHNLFNDLNRARKHSLVFLSLHVVHWAFLAAVQLIDLTSFLHNCDIVLHYLFFDLRLALLAGLHVLIFYFLAFFEQPPPLFWVHFQ